MDARITLGPPEDLDDLLDRAPIGPATSADLLELDAVPEPVDSAAPVATHLPGCAPIGPTAETRPYRKPATYPPRTGCTSSANARPGDDVTFRADPVDDVHARTLARVRP